MEALERLDRLGKMSLKLQALLSVSLCLLSPDKPAHISTGGKKKDPKNPTDHQSVLPKSREPNRRWAQRTSSSVLAAPDGRIKAAERMRIDGLLLYSHSTCLAEQLAGKLPTDPSGSPSCLLESRRSRAAKWMWLLSERMLCFLLKNTRAA